MNDFECVRLLTGLREDIMEFVSFSTDGGYSESLSLFVAAGYAICRLKGLRVIDG